ncbi:MAG: four helix bundle suffix domain-containing protein [Kiritimatiellae bacterium]|nr:four helix bundle suffix domain-containing protein [Kiritimatiellia bacterium]
MSTPTPLPILLPSTGYKRLDAYILANLVQLETLAFCRRHLPHSTDPCGRQFDQMTQAARSGVKNITEGCERIATSAQTALKLLNVAKAPLCELRDDYITFLVDRGVPPLAADSPEAKAVFAVRLDPAAYGNDINHDFAMHLIAQRAKFAPFFAGGDQEGAANVLLILLTRTLATLGHLLRRVADDFTRNGGATERMTAARIAYRRGQGGPPAPDDAPACPTCGSPMRLRHGPYGDFWGCSAHPTCKGHRPL